MRRNKKIYLLKKRKHFFEIIKLLPIKHRNRLLEYLNDDCIDIICESCHNLLNNLELSDNRQKHIRKKFKLVKNKFRMLSNPKISNKRKRKILKDEQIGNGVFTLLAGVILPSIISAISSAIAK